MSKPSLNVALLGGEVVGRGSLTTLLTHALQLRTRHLAGNRTRVQPFATDSVVYPFAVETSVHRYTIINYSHFAAPAAALPSHAPILDGAVLVVSLPEAVRFQTREHALLAREAGVHRLVLFLDMTADDRQASWRDVAEHDTREMLAELGYPADDLPVVRGRLTPAIDSGGTDEDACRCLDELLETLDSTLPSPHRDEAGPFLLTVEDVPEALTTWWEGLGRDEAPRAVRGWVERGRVRVGDAVEVVGLDAVPGTFTVASLEGLAGTVDEARVGDRVVVRLGEQRVGGRPVPMVRRPRRKGGADFLERPPVNLLTGQVLAAPGSVTAGERFEAECFVPTRHEGGPDEPLAPGALTQFRIRHRDVFGTFSLPVGVPVMMPGDRVRMEVELNTDTALAPGLRFTVVGPGDEPDLGDSVPEAFGVVTRVLR